MLARKRMVERSGIGVSTSRQGGANEGLKTRFETCRPADSPYTDGIGEVSKHYPQRVGTRPPVDQQTHCGRSDLGGEQTRRPEHQRMTAAPISSPYGSRCTDPVACRAGSNAAKADVLWEETGVCTRGTAGVWGHASGERSAEITPGRAKAQQGLATTCTDPLTEGQPREGEGSWSGA